MPTPNRPPATSLVGGRSFYAQKQGKDSAT